jgi:UPF0176 protein
VARFFKVFFAMSITNIAGYKFIQLSDLAVLRLDLLAYCIQSKLKGTILLSLEGLNVNLAGISADIEAFKKLLFSHDPFADMTFRESSSAVQPFKWMKVKIRKEIITMRRSEVRPETQRAASISPNTLKQWLDEKREITLLDTRNDYEVRFGTFKNAQHFQLRDFSHFPEAASELSTQAPIVMFCTGGIRCEKAALHLQNAGNTEVFQLEGGILNYFSEVGGSHYQGECFVFDQRISVDTQLQETGTRQCLHCYGPITRGQAACPVCSEQQIA